MGIQEAYGAAYTMHHFADQDLSTVLLKDSDTAKIYEQRSPLGVVAAITPWNFPLVLAAIKIAPALITGNTLVVKPAASTPLSTLLLGEIIAQVLPAGVVNIITDADDLGSTLTSHPDVAKISFTGSTATGKRVMANAALTIKRVTLELGGNDAAIVLDDIDIAEMAPKILHSAMINAGQVCMASKRIYAPRSLYEPLCAEMARLAEQIVVDEGTTQGVQMGPVQNRKQFERVLDLIADAANEGTIMTGGAALDRDGYFIAPTVVKDIPDTSRLVREEQFGPVVPVLAYDDLDELIERVNDTEFGLAGTIWTANPARALEIAKRIDTGKVWINTHMESTYDIPMGGAKQSGLGREFGEDGLKEFTQAKIIHMAA
jgi:acyl-CoA reductase-like NAD-dependent aldehyde dehydrogenase